MKSFTLYRRDFKNHADDNESLFNDVLRDMGFTDINCGDGYCLEDIDTCEICASGDIHAYRDNGERV